MKVVVFILLLIFLCSCNHHSNELDPHIRTIQLEHVVFACDCADWVKPDDFDRTNYADSAIYIEPADSTLVLPDTLGYNGDLIRFTGQFYKQKGYPKGYYSIESPHIAKVFRYTNYDVLKSNYRESQSVLKEKEK